MTLHIFKNVLNVGVFLFVGLAGLHGAELALPTTPYSYTVLDQDLASVLQEFGNNLKIRVNVSPEVKGRIRGRMPDLAPREFLEHLANLYNLQWYYDGLVLYVSDAHEAQSRLFVLNPITFDAFKSALDSLKISDERYVVKAATGDGVVFASGPPRFMALVEETLKGLMAEAQARRNPAPVEKPRESALMLFRGSSSMIIRGGPESFLSPDAPHQDSVIHGPGLSER
ncbi:secretin N-terminal domain-containing protein [Bradyrhizobium sp. UFLA05-112]